VYINCIRLVVMFLLENYWCIELCNSLSRHPLQGPMECHLMKSGSNINLLCECTINSDVRICLMSYIDSSYEGAVVVVIAW
jgi:hypothetical protein